MQSSPFKNLFHSFTVAGQPTSIFHSDGTNKLFFRHCQERRKEEDTLFERERETKCVATFFLGEEGGKVPFLWNSQRHNKLFPQIKFGPPLSHTQNMSYDL